MTRIPSPGRRVCSTSAPRRRTIPTSWAPRLHRLQGQHIVAELKTDSYAAFAEATYSFTQSTRLTAGVRYTKDQP